VQFRRLKDSGTSKPVIEADPSRAEGDQQTLGEAELEELIKEITIDGMCGVY
jgi:mycofactocin precursor